jgi:hypothetical protein
MKFATRQVVPINVQKMQLMVWQEMERDLKEIAMQENSATLI